MEYLIKIEQKNKKQLQERYRKDIQKLEKNIEKLERDLDLNLKEMNEKESKIFDFAKTCNTKVLKTLPCLKIPY